MKRPKLPKLVNWHRDDMRRAGWPALINTLASISWPALDTASPRRSMSTS